MDPDRRRLGELTFREYVERFRKANPAEGDAGNLLASAARAQALAELARRRYEPRDRRRALRSAWRRAVRRAERCKVCV